MNRFFVKKDDIRDNSAVITGEDLKHISKVLRMAPGDKVMLCDGEGYQYLAEISEITKDCARLEILNGERCAAEPSRRITLYQGLPKGDKMDLIVQKSVELGAEKIVPVVMKRTVVKLKNASSKCDRWQRIAEEAAKQCMRGIIPKVEEPVSFEDMLSMLREDDISILPYENEKNNKLRQCLRDNSNASRVNIIIGPEGGFEPDEVLLAEKKGVHKVTLGPRIMRCETAPLAAIAAVMYELGDW